MGRGRPPPPKKVYVAGDTGYRIVRDGEYEDQVPLSPTVSQVGELVALLPVGVRVTISFPLGPKILAVVHIATI